MFYYARSRIASDIMVMDTVLELLDRNARVAYLKWLFASTGVLMGLEFHKSTFPGSILVICLFATYCAVKVDFPMGRSKMEEGGWLYGGIGLGLLITQTVTPLQVLWFIGGYLLWPRIESIKSTNWSQLLLIAGIMCWMVACIVLDSYLIHVLPSLFGTGYIASPFLAIGLIFRAWHNGSLIPAKKRRGRPQAKKKRGRRRYAH